MDTPYIESGSLKQARSFDHAVDLLRTIFVRHYSLKLFSYLLYRINRLLSIGFAEIYQKNQNMINYACKSKNFIV